LEVADSLGLRVECGRRRESFCKITCEKKA